MPTIIIGSETAGASAIGPGAGKGYATKRECTKTGKLHIIGFTTEAASKTTKIVVGIRKEAAGAVGEWMAESAETTIEELKAKNWEIPLLTDVEIVSGTSYFLCIIPIAGTFKGKYTEEAGAGFKTTLGVTKISEGTWTTAENKFGKPGPIWGVEAEGAVVKGKATGALLLTGTATGVAAQRVAGQATGALLLTGTAKGIAAQRVVGQATGTLTLTGTAKGSTKAVVAGKATGALLFTGTAHAQVAGALFGKAAGALLLTGIATGSAAQRVAGKATGSLLLSGTATGTTKAVISGKASGALLLTGTSTATAKAVVLGKATGTLILTGTATGSAKEGAVVKAKAAGVLILTGTAHSGIAVNPCFQAIDNFKAVNMAIDNLRAAQHTIVNRKLARQVVVNL